MRKYVLSCLITICFTSHAMAVQPAKQINRKSNLLPDWRGFYMGALTGASFDKFKNRTSTQAGSLLSSAQANTVNIHGKQTLDPDGFLAGIEGGYNWQHNRLLFGLEADIQALSNYQTTNTGGIRYPSMNSTAFTLTTYGSNNWLFTARPRLGFVSDSGILYITGGPAVTLLQSDFLFVDSNNNIESKQVDQYKLGYSLGAGFETGLTDNVSLKAEYLFARFNKTNAHGMSSNLPAGQSFSNYVDLKMDMLRLGLNYHFDRKNASPLFSQLFPMLLNENAWEVNLGVRPFFSTGVAGAPQPLFGGGHQLVSRLIYEEMNAISLETFARFDHQSGLFLKGYLGAGSITSGQMVDEDFPAGGAYSHTLSRAQGNLSYANIDFGFSSLQTTAANTGMFIGYNYYEQDIRTYNCRQLANASGCENPADFDGFLIISQQNHFKSLRLGLASQFNVTDRLSLSAEAAYLPFVNFRALDNHNARQLTGPEQSNIGNGSMLETALSYHINHDWDLAVGGRYWMWNMRDGRDTFQNLDGSEENSTQPARFNTYRYGVFLAINYSSDGVRFDSASSDPFDWQGWYVGGQLGGMWGESKWPDPFGATSGSSRINAAGFGGTIHVIGPLGGFNTNYNWQVGRWVYGLGARAMLSDIRGDDTLFSGIGGVNGETIIQSLLAATGRVGYLYERSLMYLNAGPALLNIKNRIIGNTGALTLGVQSKTATQWGVVLGAGIEYAITGNWTTKVEYNFVHVPSYSVSFPDITTIANQNYKVRQNLSMFNVGLNYKFA